MFDAAFYAPNAKHYFFAGSVYWRFDSANHAVDPGYPLKISQVWDGVPDNLDAAYRSRGGWNFDKIYFIKGRRVWRYDFTDGKVDSGYPKSVKDELSGFWDNGIDAAVDFGDYLRYVFRHNRVRQLDTNGTVKKEVTPIYDLFPGVPSDLSAAVTHLTKSKSVFHFFERDLTQSPSRPVEPAKETAMIGLNVQSPGTNAVWLNQSIPGFNVRLTPTQENAVVSFAKDTRRSKFPMLDRASIAQQLRDRLSDPRAVNQINTGFCGPAAIVYWLVKTQPETYIEVVDELFHLGKFRTHGKTYVPDDEFLEASANLATVGGGRIEDIDWMVMGAIRSASGISNSIDGDSQENGASPRLMVEWCKEILGYDTVEHERSYALGEHKALDAADAAFNRNGVGFLNLASSTLKDGVEIKKKDDDTGLFERLGDKLFGDHWVVYEGDYWCDPGKVRNRKDGRFSFRVYSWGRLYHLSLSEVDFRNAMYGAVTAS